jgi:hypothetical protein
MFEEGLVPAQDRMIRVFHEQGARYVISLFE